MVEAALRDGAASASASSRSSPGASPKAALRRRRGHRPPARRHRELPVRRARDRPAPAARTSWTRTTLEFLAGYRFNGDIWGYAEGEVLLPLLTRPRGRVRLRPWRPARDRGPQRPQPRQRRRHGRLADDLRRRRPSLHRDGVPPHARGGRRGRRPRRIHRWVRHHLQPGGRPAYGVPTAGTAAHAFTLLHDDEREAFAAQIESLGKGTTLLVDTYDVARAVRIAVEIAGPSSAPCGSTRATC